MLPFNSHLAPAGRPSQICTLTDRFKLTMYGSGPVAWRPAHVRQRTARGSARGLWCQIPALCQCAPVLRQGCEEDLSLFLEEADHFLLSEKPRKKRRHLKNECAATALLLPCCLPVLDTLMAQHCQIMLAHPLWHILTPIKGMLSACQIGLGIMEYAPCGCRACLVVAGRQQMQLRTHPWRTGWRARVGLRLRRSLLWRRRQLRTSRRLMWRPNSSQASSSSSAPELSHILSLSQGIALWRA